jgi:hypothetical protein
MRDACSLNHRVLILACAAPRFFCLQLYDKDRITRDDFVGESTLDLCDARKLRNKRLTVPVYRGAKHRGTLSLIVNFTPSQQQTSHSNSQHAGVGTSATGCGCQSSAAGANSHNSKLQQQTLLQQQQQQQWAAAEGPYAPSYAADDVASVNYSDLGPSVSEAAWGVEQQEQQQQQQWRLWPADAAYRQLDQQLTVADAAGATIHDTLLDGFFAAAAASGAAAAAAGTAGAAGTACCGDGAGRAVGSVSPRVSVLAVTTPWAQQQDQAACEDSCGTSSSSSSSTSAAVPPAAAQQYVVQDMQGLGYPAVYACDADGITAAATAAAGDAVASAVTAGGNDGMSAAAAAAQRPSQQQYPQVYAGSAAATAASDAHSVGCSGSSISTSDLTTANQQQQQLAEQEIDSSGAAFRVQLQQSLHQLHQQQQETHAQVQANEARIEAASMVRTWWCLPLRLIAGHATTRICV